MTNPNKSIYKIFFYLIIVLIFFFLIKSLVANWQQIKDFDFSFNYYYLILAILIYAFSWSGLSFIWHKILTTLEPEPKLTKFQALRIYVISEFSRYVPGKVWTILGKIYFGAKYGISKRNLFLSSFLDSLISLLALFFVGLLLLTFFLATISPSLYIASLAILIIGLAAIHPKVFYPLFNFLLLKIKKADFTLERKLTYLQILKFFSYYSLAAFFRCAAFFLFILAIIPSTPWNYFFFIIGAYALAGALGIIVLFAPSGLGIREGSLTAILSYYLPTSVAIYISFLARIMTTLTELAVLILILIIHKLKKA